MRKFIKYDSLERYLGPLGIDRRQFERLSAQGHAPAGFRVMPKKQMWWEATSIAAYLSSLLGEPIEVGDLSAQ